MPFLVYSVESAQFIGQFTTSGTPNTEVDHLAISPGTRNVGLYKVTGGGKGVGLTAISGISLRFKRWTTHASSTSNFVSPQAPADPGMQTAKIGVCGTATAGTGTGGPLYLGGVMFGAGGPGGWTARDASRAMWLEGSADQSIDLFSASSLASAAFDWSLGLLE